MTLLILDADVLCYKACETRWHKKAEIGDGVARVALDADGNRVRLQWSREEDRAYLQEAWVNFLRLYDKLKDELFATDVLAAVKGEDNFRNALYPAYKLNRHSDPNSQNHVVPLLRKLAAKEDLAVEAHGFEADDLICIWATQAREAGVDYVVASIDKDLQCIPGRHWLIHKNKMITVSEEDAMRHYYTQLIVGDSTDNIRGVPGVGPVKAYRALEMCREEEEFQEAVVGEYLNYYGDKWEEALILNGRMIHLLRRHDDYFRVADWPVVRGLKEIM